MTQNTEKQVPVAEQKLAKENARLESELRQTRARLHALNKMNGVLINHNLEEAVAHSDNERSILDQNTQISNMLGDSQIANNQLNTQLNTAKSLSSLRDLVSLATVQGIEAIREHDVTDLKQIATIHEAIYNLNKCTHETISSNFDEFQNMLSDMFAPVKAPEKAPNAKIELKKSESEGESK